MSIFMNRSQRRSAKKHLELESTKYPAHLVQIQASEFNSAPPPKLISVWRSRDYLVQLFAEPSPCVARMTVCRASIDSKGGWQQDIPWEDMQRLKHECGYGELDAVEVFPRNADIVNVANMRHVFVLERPLSFAWRKTKCH